MIFKIFIGIIILLIIVILIWLFINKDYKNIVQNNKNIDERTESTKLNSKKSNTFYMGAFCHEIW